MSAAFEEAWIFLKAAFQPAEGDFLGSGANQYVYRQPDNPDVVKVGGAFGLKDMYLLNRLAAERPDLFVSQQPIPITQELPMEAQAFLGHRAPVLSIQERGQPLPESGMNAMRESKNLSTLAYDQPGGELFEALGMSDVKLPNWMTRLGGQSGSMPIGVLSRRAPSLTAGYYGEDGLNTPAFIMDPAFDGPENVGGRIERMMAEQRRGSPRKFGVDYDIPEEQRESFARRIDELPYEEFVDPIYNTEIPMSDAQAGLLDDMAMGSGERADAILQRIGVL